MYVYAFVWEHSLFSLFSLEHVLKLSKYVQSKMVIQGVSITKELRPWIFTTFHILFRGSQMRGEAFAGYNHINLFIIVVTNFRDDSLRYHTSLHYHVVF